MIERSWSAAKVADYVASLDVWKGRPAVAPLFGGLTNLNFKVEDETGAYVARIGFDIAAHDIYQPNVIAAMTAAAGAGISPRLHHASGQVAVTEFMPGGPLQPGSFADEATLVDAVGLLKRLHGLGSNIAGPTRYSYPFQKVVRNCVFLREEGSRHAAETVELEALSRTLEAQVPPFLPTMVHTDVLPQNLVRDADGRLRLIDWDYAGIGHPLADLASMTINGEIPAAQWDHVLRLYLEREPEAGDRKLFSLLCVMQALVEYLWGTVQELVSDLPAETVAASMATAFDGQKPTFEGYCEVNLGRFRTALRQHVEAFGPV